MATLFPYAVSNTPAGLPGQIAGARKPGSSKGYLVTNNTTVTPNVLGVTVGNFAYQVADSEDQCVGTNTTAIAASIVGITPQDTGTNIDAYVNPTLVLIISGIQYTVTPSPAFVNIDNYSAIAAKLQTGLQAALAGTQFATTATVTYTGTSPNSQFNINLGVKGQNSISLSPTQLATGMGLTAAGVVTTQGSSGLNLLGIVTRANTYVGTDIGAIEYDPGFSNTVTSGQNVDILQRGSVYVLLNGFLVGTSAAMYSYIYSRDLDGAVFIGNTSQQNFSGYTRSNFMTTSASAVNIANGIIRIANDERVGN